MQAKVQKGFSLIEILIVLAIVAIIVVGFTSSTVGFYQTTIITGDLNKLVTQIRAIRQDAVANGTGSAYSIKFLSDRFVAFPGTTYSAGNSENEEFELDTGVIVSTTFTSDQLIFENFTGRAQQAGSVFISGFGKTKEVVINSLGILEEII